MEERLFYSSQNPPAIIGSHDIGWMFLEIVVNDKSNAEALEKLCDHCGFDLRWKKTLCSCPKVTSGGVETAYNPGLNFTGTIQGPELVKFGLIPRPDSLFL